MLSDIYKQNSQILTALSNFSELTARIASLEGILVNKDLNRRDASEFLNCSEKTIERATKAGDVEYNKIGRNYYYSKKALLEFKESRTYRK